MITMNRMRKTRINYTEIFEMYGNNEKIKGEIFRKWIRSPLFDNHGFIYDVNYDINYCVGIANNYQFELRESFYNDKYVVLSFRKIKCKTKDDIPPIQRRVVNEI